MAGIKIVDLPALGRDLAATDLLELSLAGGTGSRKITGQEIINASKLNVGTTPIINGTAGRILFQGSGDILQQSSSLSYDDTTKAFTLSGNQNGQTLLNVSNTTSGTASNAALTLTSDASSGFFNAFKVSTTYTTYKTLVAKDAGFYNTGLGGDFSFLNDSSTGRFKIAVGASSTAQFIVQSTGNVGIGTTTDAGFKLDVNGATRIKGTGTTSSTTAFTVQNSAGTTYFSIKDDGALSSSGTDTGIYSNFTTGNKSPLLFSHSGYGTNTPNDTRIDFGYRGRQAGGLNSYDFFTYKVYQGADPTVTTGFEFYTHQNQTSSLASQLAMAINGSNVGIGTSSPANKLDIKGTGDVVLIDSNAVASRVTLKLNTTSASYTQIIGNGTEFNLATLGSTHITFATNSSERVRIGSTTGNVLINTTTDAGFRLDVNGTARIQGTTTLNDVATCLQGLRVNGGYTAFNASTILGSASQSGNTFNFSTQYIGGATGTTNYFNFSGTLASGTGGSFNVFNVQQTFSNTNSSQTFRGFYYNPNITGLQAGTAHWAIHTTSGRVRFEGLPTSPTGLNAGDLWNDAGTLRIV